MNRNNVDKEADKVDVDMQEPPEKRLKQDPNSEGADKKEEDSGKEKVIKTDKVLLGNKVSWAVAQTIGEVGDIRPAIAVARKETRWADKARIT